MRKFLWIILILTIVIPLGTSYAFPGDETDEQCEALVQQALAAIEQGGTSAQPNCVLNTGLSGLESRVAAAEMERYPAPNVVQIQPIEEVVHLRKYRRLYPGAVIYDAPNGNALRSIGEGLTLVSYLGVLNDWVQVRASEWVPIDVTRTYEVSTFAGVEINAPLARPFAWMLAPVKPSVYPGGPEYEGYAEIPRYQIMNVYGVEIVDGFEWYLIGENQWIQQIRVAKVKPVDRPEGVGENEKWLAVDLFEQTAVGYVGDRMVYATLISSGLPQWSTEEGLFQIYQRWVNGPMSGAAGYLGDAYNIENIANIMYFNGDMALHAAYWHDKFGYRQSRGCVNLSLMDAHWIYEWTRDDEDAWVYVYSSDRYRSDLPAWAIRPR